MRKKGTLVPLKTTLELRAEDATVEVFATLVEGRKASGALNLIKALIPEDGGLDFGHLRRFVKFEDVQEGVRKAFREAKRELEKEGSRNESTSLESDARAVVVGSTPEMFSSIPTKGMEVIASSFAPEQNQISVADLLENAPTTATATATATANQQPESAASSNQASTLIPKEPKNTNLPSTLPAQELRKLFMLVGSVNVISHSAVVKELDKFVGTGNSIVFSISVPHLAPTSSEQAIHWTSKYWPTVYKKNNPFGPHPSIVSRAEQELYPDVEKWMALAWDVARESKKIGYGEEIGVVIVERRNGIAKPIAVAGDGRWIGWEKSGSGNVTAHPTLRAIAMVAKGVRDRRMGKTTGDSADAIFQDGSNTQDPKNGVEADGQTIIMPGAVDLRSSDARADHRCGDRMIDNIPDVVADEQSLLKAKDLIKESAVDGSSYHDLDNNAYSNKQSLSRPDDLAEERNADEISGQNLKPNSSAHGSRVPDESRFSEDNPTIPSKEQKWREPATNDETTENFANPRKEIVDTVQGNCNLEHVGLSFPDREDRKLRRGLNCANIDIFAVDLSTELNVVRLGVGKNGQALTAVVAEESQSKDRAGGITKAAESQSDINAKKIAGNAEDVTATIKLAHTDIVAKRPAPGEGQTGDNSKIIRVDDIFQDQPMLEIEERQLDPFGTEVGYLCHELEIYCTHEPCVMCSMGIIHSRFGRVVFERRMLQTGGLCADGELGHGLFWRKELNWTMLAWYLDREPDDKQPTDSHLHA